MKYKHKLTETIVEIIAECKGYYFVNPIDENQEPFVADKERFMNFYEPLEEEQDWIFTFCSDSSHANDYIVFHGTHSSARNKMIERFETYWGFQYETKEEAGVKKYHLKEIK